MTWTFSISWVIAFQRRIKIWAPSIHRPFGRSGNGHSWPKILDSPACPECNGIILGQLGPLLDHLGVGPFSEHKQKSHFKSTRNTSDHIIQYTLLWCAIIFHKHVYNLDRFWDMIVPILTKTPNTYNIGFIE